MGGLSGERNISFLTGKACSQALKKKGYKVLQLDAIKNFVSKLKKIKPTIFISGHSHILKVQYDKKLNILHLNPGAAGKYGFHTIRTMLRFELDKGEIKNLEIIELATKT